MFVGLVSRILTQDATNVQTFSTTPEIMTRKTREKIMQDEMVDELYPYLPPNYASIARHFRPEINAMRLYNVVRKRGTEADPEAYRALLSVKNSTPVARRPRKKHARRRPAHA